MRSGPEQCMVHNGSFANHATIRRELRSAGVELRQRERHRGGCAVHRASSSPTAATSRRRSRSSVRHVRRLLHAAGVQPRFVRRGPRRHRLQARGDRRDRRLGGDGQRIPRSGRTSRRREGRRSGSPSRRWSTHGHDRGDDVRPAHAPRCGRSTRRCTRPICPAAFVIDQSRGRPQRRGRRRRTGHGHGRRPRRVLRRGHEPARRRHRRRQRGHRRRREHDERHRCG